MLKSDFKKNNGVRSVSDGVTLKPTPDLPISRTVTQDRLILGLIQINSNY
jgi:hypothetical protein